MNDVGQQPAVIGSIVVVGALTCALLHLVCYLKAAEMWIRNVV